ncbi:hypothetical protein Cni_G13388 [Canna indica]|uniref:Uncharacterized protein n=1 Tax=Canna indica TaxID=4628 RepID=A0AAQ3QCN0_9LILI|nr:hypothetical protein Cni_G13388 [Canna indica]
MAMMGSTPSTSTLTQRIGHITRPALCSSRGRSQVRAAHYPVSDEKTSTSTPHVSHQVKETILNSEDCAGSNASTELQPRTGLGSTTHRLVMGLMTKEARGLMAKEEQELKMERRRLLQ